MPRTTKEQANSALKVFKTTAKRLGLDYSDYDFVKYTSGYSLMSGGAKLLIRGQRSLSQWYDILDAANEALLAVERQLIKQVDNLEK